jgi:hypothetical protein
MMFVLLPDLTDGMNFEYSILQAGFLRATASRQLGCTWYTTDEAGRQMYPNDLLQKLNS